MGLKRKTKKRIGVLCIAFGTVALPAIYGSMVYASFEPMMRYRQENGCLNYSDVLTMPFQYGSVYYGNLVFHGAEQAEEELQNYSVKRIQELRNDPTKTEVCLSISSDGGFLGIMPMMD